MHEVYQECMTAGMPLKLMYVVSVFSARSVVAEVRPGDMLVVPPFWFHHVETLEESVSVNVWSDAPEYDLINQV